MLLVRHGQSEWNAVGRWQGQADPVLTDLGRDQASAAARSRSLGSFDAVVSSPLQRSVDTATVLADAIGVGPVLTDAGLMERDAGPWQGLTRAQIEEAWPGMLASGDRPDGYERDGALLARVMSALAGVADMVAGGSALVVTHAGVVYAVEGTCGERMVRLPNLGGRWLDLDDGNLVLGPRVDLVPDATIPDLL